MTPFPYKSVVRVLEPTPNHTHCFFVAQRNTLTMWDDSQQQAFCLTPRCRVFRYVDSSNARLATTEELYGLIRTTIHEARKSLLSIDTEVSTSLDPDLAKMDSNLRRAREYAYRLEVLLAAQQTNRLALPV